MEICTFTRTFKNLEEAASNKDAFNRAWQNGDGARWGRCKLMMVGEVSFFRPAFMLRVS